MQILTEKDHEIFRLKDEIDLYEGQGTTFYGISHLDPNLLYHPLLTSARLSRDLALRVPI